MELASWATQRVPSPKAISTPLGTLMVATTWPVTGSMRCAPASVALSA
jgi:hypothetical protein